MKRTISLTAFLIAGMISIAAAQTKPLSDTLANQHTATDSLADYTGQYQKTINGETYYIAIEAKGGNLIGTSLWDGKQVPLKHLAGDKYLATGVQWPVEFLRDKKSVVTQLLLRDQEYWKKVKK